MYCRKCGENLHPDAKFCPSCGLAAEARREIAGPPVPGNGGDPVSGGGPVVGGGEAIWNPNAASGWSFLFTPAFGSYLHALNWRALGDEEKADKAMMWFYASVALLIGYVLAVLFFLFKTGNPKAGEFAGRLMPLPYFIAWYFLSARDQAKYVKSRFGENYPRKAWGKPLMIAVASVLGYWVLAFGVGMAYGVIMAIA